MAHVDDILNTDPVGNNVEGGFGKSEATNTGGSSFRHVQVVVPWVNHRVSLLVTTVCRLVIGVFHVFSFGFSIRVDG